MAFGSSIIVEPYLIKDIIIHYAQGVDCRLHQVIIIEPWGADMSACTADPAVARARWPQASLNILEQARQRCHSARSPQITSKHAPSHHEHRGSEATAKR